jgi:predicted Rossmann fold nucleotide-binding protein DprA/Smf involved in DNA uptake
MNRTNIFQTVGNVELLSQKKIALFASKNAPDELDPAANELADKLFQLPLAVASGWQSPLEKSVYQRFNNKCTANIIHYVAKDINQFKPTEKQQKWITQNKLLIISPELKEIRTSASVVDKRDRLIFSQNKKILFLYIESKGRLEKYFKELSQLNFQLYILEHPLNESYFHDDIIRFNDNSVESLLL